MEKKMLVLTRRNNESIIISDNIVLTVLAVNGNQVKIGINAPKDIPVHREEIFKKIQSEKLLEENQSAQLNEEE